MAKRRSSGRTTTRTQIIKAVPIRTPQPIIRVSAPRAAPSRKHHRKGRRHGGGGSTKGKLIATGIAGYVLGMVDKSGTAIPTVPMLGRAGTVAAAAYFLGKGRGIWGDVALAAIAIAGYEMGSTGKIAGADIAPQVSGIAAQV